MPNLKLREGRLYYQLIGEKGPYLLMLRGLARSSSYWLGYEKKLSDEFRVISLDYRGIGKSTAPLPWLGGFELMVEDLKALKIHLKIDQWHIFGLSLGGMLAMEYAARFPKDVASLAIANSSSSECLLPRIKPSALVKLITKAPLMGFHSSLVELLTNRDLAENQGQKILNAWKAIRKKEGFPALTLVKQLVAVRNFKVAGRLSGKNIPTLILYGEDDAFVYTQHSLSLKKLISESKLFSLSGVGHEISIGQPQQLKKLLVDFFLSDLTPLHQSTRRASAKPRKARLVVAPSG